MLKSLLKNVKPWYVITHANCMDGFGVYLSCMYFAYTNNIKLPSVMYMNYGDNLDIDKLKDSNVIIGDFSFDKETLLRINNISNMLIVLDHHESASMVLNDLPFCKFDNTKSGARLVYEYLFNTKRVPLLIEYIEDRDLWLWEKDYSKEISAYLSILDKSDLDLWINLLQNEAYLLSTINIGNGILTYQEQSVKSKCKNAEDNLVSWCGEYTVPFINTTTLISEIGNKLSEEYPFAIMYFITNDSIVFSFRSSDKNIDLTKLSLPRGHKHAAGRSFLLKDIDLNILFTAYDVGSYLTSINHLAK